MSKLKALHDYVLVEEMESSNTTAGGIVLTTTNKSTKKYKILDAGPEVTNLRKNDVVYIVGQQALPINDMGVVSYLIREEYVVGLIN